jgi:hypothetical protein
VDSWQEFLDFINGFKDGIVGVTGEDSKSYICNANISIAEKVWYTDYEIIFSDETKWVEDLAV